MEIYLGVWLPLVQVLLKSGQTRAGLNGLKVILFLLSFCLLIQLNWLRSWPSYQRLSVVEFCLILCCFYSRHNFFMISQMVLVLVLSLQSQILRLLLLLLFWDYLFGILHVYFLLLFLRFFLSSCFRLIFFLFQLWGHFLIFSFCVKMLFGLLFNRNWSNILGWLSIVNFYFVIRAIFWILSFLLLIQHHLSLIAH